MDRAEIIAAIESMTVLELAELVKELEEKFGVSAAAPVAVAAAPVAVFATSLVVEGAGVSMAALALAGCWMLITVWALNTHSLKYLDDKESHPDPIPFVPDAERI